LLDRRQPKARATEARRDGDIGLRERAEQPLDFGERQPDAAVRHREGDAHLAFRRLHARHFQRDAALLGELDGVVDEIFQRRAQPHRIADDECRQRLRDPHGRLQALCRRTAGQRIPGAARQRPQVEKILPDAKASLPTGVAAARGVDEQRSQPGQMFGSSLDSLDPAPLALAEIRGRQQIAHRENAGQRRAHLVRERCQRGFHHARLAGHGSAPSAHRLWPHGCLARPLLRRSLLARSARYRRHDPPNLV